MTAQDDINAAAVAIQAVATDLATNLATFSTQLDTLTNVLTLIQQEMSALRGMGVDTSALNTAVGTLNTAALDTAMQGLVTAVANAQALTTSQPD